MSLHLRRNLGFTFVGVTLIAMLAMTWRTWPEPVIDFGRELYVPWQLSQGKVLYRDIAYFNGPLSPYFNALVFRLLGVSLMKLVAVNLAIFVTILVMMHRLAARMSNEWIATVASCALVILLGVGQPGPVGNYNYLTPYSHEMTHGLALSLAAIVALMKYAQMRRSAWIAASGVLIGLAFLTKPEIFAAAGVSVSIGTLLATRRSERKVLDLSLFCASAIAIVFVALALLWLVLPLRQAVGGIVGACRWTMDSRITSNPFYQRVRGTFDIDETIDYLLAMAIGYTVLFALPAVIGWFISGDRRQPRAQLVASFILTVMLLWWAHGFIKWEEVGRGLIFVLPVCVVVTLRRINDDAAILKCVFALFALLMLAKSALHVQFYHYGFVLTAPSLIVTIMALLHWLPAWIERNGGSGALLRGATLAALVVTGATYVYYENLVARRKTTLVGAGGDAFYTQAEGNSVNRVVERLKTTPSDATVVVAPQGVMINYLARRTSSIPFIVQMPPEVIMFSQGRMIDSFQTHPPDYVVYLEANTTEYGYRGYAADFGRPIFEWIMGNYRPIAGEPQSPNLKWLLLERKR